MLDENNAPKGYKAIKEDDCGKCAFFGKECAKLCFGYGCTRKDRPDKTSVVFVEN